MHLTISRLALWLAIAATSLFIGCQTSAKRLAVAPVKRILPGQTTMAEVEKEFGRPHERVASSDGRTVARYFYGEPRLNNHVSEIERWDHPIELVLRTLTLSYGSNSIIERKLHDESLTTTLRNNQRLEAGPRLKAGDLQFLRRGQTTKADLLAHLGEPTCTTFESDGLPLLMWFSGTYRLNFVTDSEAKRLVVKLKTDSTVDDFAVMDNDLDFLWRSRR
jgi:hypothetical protein